MEFRIKHQLKF